MDAHGTAAPLVASFHKNFGGVDRSYQEPSKPAHSLVMSIIKSPFALCYGGSPQDPSNWR